MAGVGFVRPMIISDFAPCFQLSTHRYKYNNYVAYGVLRRASQDWQVRMRFVRACCVVVVWMGGQPVTPLARLKRLHVHE
jgi:hypothetical protein